MKEKWTRGKKKLREREGRIFKRQRRRKKRKKWNMEK